MARNEVQTWALRGVVALTVLAPAAHARAMDRFSAPTGQLGANLVFDEAIRARAHAEMSYFTAGGAATTHAFAWTLAAAVKVTDEVEVEVGLPVAGVALSGGLSGDQFAVGNLTLGANYFTRFSEELRLKVGGLVAFGPWNQRDGLVTGEGAALYLAGIMTSAYQDFWQYLPSYVSLVVPVRVEYGQELQVTGDANLMVAIPTLDADAEVFVTLAPGVAYWATPRFSLGARLPLQLMSVSAGAQLSLEPYLRLDVGERVFLSTRFTLNLDEPLGFSFESGRYWGLHLAFGGSF